MMRFQRGYDGFLKADARANTTIPSASHRHLAHIDTESECHRGSTGINEYSTWTNTHKGDYLKGEHFAGKSAGE